MPSQLLLANIGSVFPLAAKCQAARLIRRSSTRAWILQGVNDILAGRTGSRDAFGSSMWARFFGLVVSGIAASRVARTVARRCVTIVAPKRFMIVVGGVTQLRPRIMVVAIDKCSIVVAIEILSLVIETVIEPVEEVLGVMASVDVGVVPAAELANSGSTAVCIHNVGRHSIIIRGSGVATYADEDER